MSIEEISQRWEGVAPRHQCESWWYSAIRHCQRNVDSLCPHETWPEKSTDQPDVHPDRYEGARYAHAAADIHFLLSLIKQEEVRI